MFHGIDHLLGLQSSVPIVLFLFFFFFLLFFFFPFVFSMGIYWTGMSATFTQLPEQHLLIYSPRLDIPGPSQQPNKTWYKNACLLH